MLTNHVTTQIDSKLTNEKQAIPELYAWFKSKANHVVRDLECFFSTWNGVTVSDEDAKYKTTLLPAVISQFIKNIVELKPHTQNELLEVSSALKEIKGLYTRGFIIFVITSLYLAALKKMDIKKITDDIEETIRKNKSKDVPEKLTNVAWKEEYNIIQNIYFFLNNIRDVKYNDSEGFLNGDTEFAFLEAEAVFALNVFALTGMIPKEKQENYKLLSFPLYPDQTKKVAEKIKNYDAKLVAQKGMKPANLYYPIKLVRDLSPGDNLYRTFLATDKRKIFYVREGYAPQCILASEIANIISPLHFSLEELWEYGLVASSELESYRIPVSRGRHPIFTAQDCRAVLPGSGIVDEVSRFIVETDPNLENLAYSSLDAKDAHLCKIDFDKCAPGIPMSTLFKLYKDVDYEKPHFFYHQPQDYSTREEYISERLRTRLKFIMFPPEIFPELIKKAYIDVGDEQVKEMAKELSDRTNFLFDLFLNNPNAKKLFADNVDDVLKEIRGELHTYINQHFDKSIANAILVGLSCRLDTVRQKIAEKFAFTPINDEKIYAEDLIHSCKYGLLDRVNSLLKHPMHQPSAALLQQAMKEIPIEIVRLQERWSSANGSNGNPADKDALIEQTAQLMTNKQNILKSLQQKLESINKTELKEASPATITPQTRLFDRCAATKFNISPITIRLDNCLDFKPFDSISIEPVKSNKFSDWREQIISQVKGFYDVELDKKDISQLRIYNNPRGLCKSSMTVCDDKHCLNLTAFGNIAFISVSLPYEKFIKPILDIQDEKTYETELARSCKNGMLKRISLLLKHPKFSHSTVLLQKIMQEIPEEKTTLVKREAKLVQLTPNKQAVLQVLQQHLDSIKRIELKKLNPTLQKIAEASQLIFRSPLSISKADEMAGTANPNKGFVQQQNVRPK